MSLQSEADALYALLPEDFTAARNARAKEVRADGDRDLADRIRKLSKPRTSAWVLNVLVRHDPDEIDRLLALGHRIRVAQTGSGDEDVSDLHQERRQLSAALTQQARTLAGEHGYELKDEMAAEIESTLRAAMADPAGGAAIRTGRLIATFSATGFEPVDIAQVVAVADAVVVPAMPAPAPPSPRAKAKAPAKTKAPVERRVVRGEKKPPRNKDHAPAAPTVGDASETLRKARESLAAAEQALERADRCLADATEHRTGLDAERTALQQRLRTLEQELFGAHRAEETATRLQQRAAKTYANAQRAVERAERRVND